jgi:hypothetical protein
VGSYDYKVYALNAATDAQRWAFATGGYVSSSMQCIKTKPGLRAPHTSMKMVIPLPHVLGPKYERQQRPRNSQGFRIGASREQ